MGRRKAYERDAVLARAMNAFWADGFHATSSRDLADAMGINVSTVYTEFGNKEALYSAALDYYDQSVVSAFFGPLESPEASLATVRAVVRQFPMMARQVANAPGCLVTNAVIDQAPTREASQDAMARYADRISKGIQHALGNELAGKRCGDADLRQIANQLVATLVGLFVMARAQIDPTMLDDVAESAVRQVDDFVAQFAEASDV